MNPLIAALMSEAWAMDPIRVKAMIAEIDAAPVARDMSAAFGLLEKAPLAVDGNGVATIPIHGVIMKSVHPIMKMLGFGGADLGDIKAQLVDALLRDDVKAIVLDIDSPGGTVSGTKELADEIYASRGMKPMRAEASGTLASSAYWIASQADRITATVGTSVGSIGVYGVIPDSSKAATDAGVKVHVVSSHPLKAAGVEGAPVSDAHLADMQRHVDTLASLFRADVARGRGMDAKQIEALATGQVWVGEEAKSNGLVDEIAKPTAKQRRETMDIEKLKAELAAKTAEAAASAAAALELTAKITALEAKLTELGASLAAAHVAQRDTMIARYEDRVAPADLAAIKEYGEFCGADIAKFEAHLKARPSVTRPTRVSEPGAPPSTDPQGELAPAVLAVAKQLGNSVQDIRKYGGLSA